MIEFVPGSVDVSLDFFIQDSSVSTGEGKTGLVYNTSGLQAYYRRDNGALVQITLATLANAQAAHSDGGFVEIDSTNMPGAYRLDPPDAVVASGASYVTLYILGTGIAPTVIRIYLREVVTTNDVVDAIDAAGAAVGELTAAPTHADGFFTQVKQLQQVSLGKRVSDGTGQTLELYQFDGITVWLDGSFLKVGDVLTVGPLDVPAP